MSQCAVCGNPAPYLLTKTGDSLCAGCRKNYRTVVRNPHRPTSRKSLMAKLKDMMGTVNPHGFAEDDRVRIIGGEYKGEKGVIMRSMGGGHYKVGCPSGHPEIHKRHLRRIFKIRGRNPNAKAMFKKEAAEHPTLPPSAVKQIVADHIAAGENPAEAGAIGKLDDAGRAVYKKTGVPMGLVDVVNPKARKVECTCGVWGPKAWPESTHKKYCPFHGMTAKEIRAAMKNPAKPKAEIMHEGTTYYWTGKVGTHIATGRPSAEYKSAPDVIWAFYDGTVCPDKNPYSKEARYDHHRKIDPRCFQTTSFRTVPLSHTDYPESGAYMVKGAKAVVGRLKMPCMEKLDISGAHKGKWAVQTILTPKGAGLKPSPVEYSLESKNPIELYTVTDKNARKGKWFPKYGEWVRKMFSKNPHPTIVVAGNPKKKGRPAKVKKVKKVVKKKAAKVAPAKPTEPAPPGEETEEQKKQVGSIAYWYDPDYKMTLKEA